jgi:hypothetical protein
MKSFTDSGGRTWMLAVNVDSIKRVRALCNIDLLSIVDGKLIDLLMANPIQVVDVAYAICKPQADQLGVTDEQFGAAMSGDAIDGATTALLEDLTDFFPKGRRMALKAALAKVMEAESRSLTRATANIQKIDIESLMQPSAGDSSTSLPASVASIPDL